MKLPRLKCVLVAAALLAGCATSHPPLRTVGRVDLPRYMGDWRVIANIPYFAEKDCVDSIESYGLRPDGRIANTFRFRKKSFDAPQQKLEFVADVTNHRTNAEWRVQFAPLISAGYYIIDLEPNYQWTVVGHPSRCYGWIMARSKTLSDQAYGSILRRLEAQGYDSKQFVKVPQFRSQAEAAKR